MVMANIFTVIVGALSFLALCIIMYCMFKGAEFFSGREAAELHRREVVPSGALGRTCEAATPSAAFGSLHRLQFLRRLQWPEPSEARFINSLGLRTLLTTPLY